MQDVQLKLIKIATNVEVYKINWTYFFITINVEKISV